MRPFYIGAGLKMLECPLSGFHDPLIVGLVAAYADREAGIVPPWGEGSALYYEAMTYLHATVKEREAQQIEDFERKNKANGR